MSSETNTIRTFPARRFLAGVRPEALHVAVVARDRRDERIRIMAITLAPAGNRSQSYSSGQYTTPFAA
jgi:hypothetical protein